MINGAVSPYYFKAVMYWDFQDFYKAHFPYTPTEKTEMLKFTWVGGSIWGGMMGGLLTAILGVVVTKNSWAKELATRL
jgi:prolipoprotein diacylglyceryltransferase